MPPIRPRQPAVCLAALSLAILVGAPWRAHCGESVTAERAVRIAALTGAIDEALEASWQAANVPPAERADDGEFLRRVYLDLAGRIPPVSVARRFLADGAADKRERLIAELLDSPMYLGNFAGVWRSVLLPELEADFGQRQQFLLFEAWLVEQLAAETAYDEIVRRLLTVPLQGSAQRRPQMAIAAEVFYQSKLYEPPDVTGAVARAFLGLRIECAQCHDHPFAHWKQDDFWSLAAFFSRLPSAAQPDADDAAAAIDPSGGVAIRVPDTDRVVLARLLEAAEPTPVHSGDPRVTLADWITRGNPYFARATVNRVWAHLFGTGLVDPVDDFDESNPPSHPSLLARLAEEFEASGFDLKFLLAAVCQSRAYQLSSACSHPSQQDPRLFARAIPRALRPAQVYASLVEITGVQDEVDQPGEATPFQLTSEGEELIELFGPDDANATERPLSVPQALGMMNGVLVANATSPVHGALVGAVTDFPLMTTAQRVETLYLATLTRKPTRAELQPLVEYVDGGGTEGEGVFALSDVLWALLNSSEFSVNH